MNCLNAITSDERTTGEWFCIVDQTERDGVLREEMTVQIEVRSDAGTLDGLKDGLAARLKADLGLTVGVDLVAAGSLDEVANVGGREGKAKRLVDNRPGLSEEILTRGGGCAGCAVIGAESPIPRVRRRSPSGRVRQRNPRSSCP